MDRLCNALNSVRWLVIGGDKLAFRGVVNGLPRQICDDNPSRLMRTLNDMANGRY
jgi:hypothetical protein